MIYIYIFFFFFGAKFLGGGGFLKSEKTVVGVPPFSGLAQNFWVRAAVARHFALISKHPGAAPVWISSILVLYENDCSFVTFYFCKFYARVYKTRIMYRLQLFHYHDYMKDIQIVFLVKAVSYM